MEPATVARHSFDYLVIVDFEATCDENETQEIIEFPWVVFDPNSLQVIDKQQLYVKPEYVSTLPRFCTQLTGITDAMVESAPPLVSAFDEFVGTNFNAKSKSFCIVTDGGWDLKQALMRECKKKDIILAPHYFRFFDLKLAFMQCMKLNKPLSLKAMAMALSTPMEKHHSGIADCMTISHIVHQLILKGFKFSTPEAIPVDYDPDTDKDGHGYGSAAQSLAANAQSPAIAPADGTRSVGTLSDASSAPASASAPASVPAAAGGDVGQTDQAMYLGMRPGDWICPHCKDLNFAMRAYCRKCNNPVPNGAGSAAKTQPQKEGDWICSKCSGLNFAARDHCYTCRASRYSGGGGPSSRDWRCNGCGDLNFGFRTQCRRCGAPDRLQDRGGSSNRYGGGGGVGVGRGRPGDWVCPRCSDMNYASRDVCRKCQSPKLEGLPAYGYQPR